MDDIGKDLVAAGWHIGQLYDELVAVCFVGMQVQKAIHLRDPNQEQVHQMVVIKHEVGQIAWLDPSPWDLTSRFLLLHTQEQSCA